MSGRKLVLQLTYSKSTKPTEELGPNPYCPIVSALEPSAGARYCEHAVKHIYGTRGGESTSTGPAPVGSGPQRQEDNSAAQPVVSLTTSWQTAFSGQGEGGMRAWTGQGRRQDRRRPSLPDPKLCVRHASPT